MRRNILIADDEESIRFTFSEFLQAEGFLVVTAANLTECLTALKRQSFDALLLDLNLGQDNSLESLEEIKRMQPDCRVVMITGDLKPSYLAQAKRCGTTDYLVKPVYKTSLLYIVRKALAGLPAEHLPQS